MDYTSGDIVYQGTIIGDKEIDESIFANQVQNIFSNNQMLSNQAKSIKCVIKNNTSYCN
jgi:hypothetical protein